MKQKELIQLIENKVRKTLKEENYTHTPIHKWVYFGYNYEPDFIETIWNGEVSDRLIQHLKSKFNDAHRIAGNKGAMNWFYSELDSANRAILENWIIKNYKG
jgi:hypothetical protein